jgi:hypothetical protein
MDTNSAVLGSFSANEAGHQRPAECHTRTGQALAHMARQSGFIEATEDRF